MNYILIPILIVAMVMAVISLIRGIVAFLNATRDDLMAPHDGQPTANQLTQNKMMTQRIFYQAGAIVVVAILLFATHK